MSQNQKEDNSNSRRTSGGLAKLQATLCVCTTSAESPQTTPESRRRAQPTTIQTDARPFRTLQSTSSVLTEEREDSSTESLISPTTTSVNGQNAASKLDLDYKTDGPKRGEVLIINNITFAKGKERLGAEKDEEDLDKLMTDIGFEVKLYQNLPKKKMVEKINKFKSRHSLTEADISVVVIMSHGTNTKLKKTSKKRDIVRGGYTNIIGTDEKGLEYDSVLDEFTAINCPQMAGKPKIFIFQCCRGDKDETPLRDDLSEVIKDHGDMLLAFSTIPGFYAYRDRCEGSWYIQSICKIFRNNAHYMDVETMLKLVDQDLSSISKEFVQTSSYESRGFNKRCFLNPIKQLYDISMVGNGQVNNLQRYHVDGGIQIDEVQNEQMSEDDTGDDETDAMNIDQIDEDDQLDVLQKGQSYNQEQTNNQMSNIQNVQKVKEDQN